MDLITGRSVTLKDGSLRRAVMASSALPGLMPPIAWDGMLLADGAVLEAVPCAASRELGAKIVIAVDVGSRLESPPEIRDGVDVVQRATEIMMLHLRSAGRRVCDVLVEPNVTPFTWADFDRYADIVSAGEQAARRRLPAIRSALRRGRRAIQIQRLRTRLAGRGKFSPSTSTPIGENVATVDRGK